MKLAHLINPAEFPSNSALQFAQKVTFKCIVRAANEAKEVKLELLTTQFEEDEKVVPLHFRKLSNLRLHTGAINSDLSKRKLPFLKEILNKAKALREADYLIYSNIDIALMPYFYQEVQRQLESGHDALVINRRRISDTYSSLSELPAMYADIGYSHPGFDCFIFKRELIDQFELGNICVGVPFSGVSLLHNVLAFSNNPKVIMDKHLTFHLGTDVLNFRRDEYYWHNRKEYFEKVKPKLQPYLELKKFPYADLPRFKRSVKWMLNPSLATKDLVRFELKNFKQRLKNWRWDILQS